MDEAAQSVASYLRGRAAEYQAERDFWLEQAGRGGPAEQLNRQRAERPGDKAECLLEAADILEE